VHSGSGSGSGSSGSGSSRLSAPCHVVEVAGGVLVDDQVAGHVVHVVRLRDVAAGAQQAACLVVCQVTARSPVTQPKRSRSPQSPTPSCPLPRPTTAWRGPSQLVWCPCPYHCTGCAIQAVPLPGFRCDALRCARRGIMLQPPPPPCARVPELLLLDVALVLLVSARLAVALHHHLCLGGAEVLVQVHGPDGTAGVGLQSDVIGDGCRRAAAGQGRERERV